MGPSVHDISNNIQPVKHGFEQLYTIVRRYEEKIYTDEQLLQLPDFDTRSQEWEIRKQSSGRLIAYLKKKSKHLNMMEVGCGNGWLSAKLADIPGTLITGLDVNKREISLAKRVFKKPNLEFVCDEFNEGTFNQEKFDIILFSASLQYFPSVITVLQNAMQILNGGGEIHIIDTPFYTSSEAAKAAVRCRKYYTDMGIPEMANYYFHHSVDEFWGLNYRVLLNPGNLVNRLFKKNPFYWIVVK